MTEAAFKACYSEWRMIKTRATVQLVFEIPIEQADAAYQALGGMPIAAKEVWCGIARLSEPVSRQPLPVAEERPGPVSRPPAQMPVRAEKERRAFSDLLPSQQAGILCNEPAFSVFLSEKFPDLWGHAGHGTASIVREICKVDSRADIKPDNVDWSALVLAYRLWKHDPEYMGFT